MKENGRVNVDHTALDQYREVMGDEADEFILEIVQTFVQRAQSMVNQIAENFNAGAVGDFHMLVHSMKSNLKLVGAYQSSNKYEDLENLSSIDLQQIDHQMVHSAGMEVLMVCDELHKQYPGAGRQEG